MTRLNKMNRMRTTLTLWRTLLYKAKLKQTQKTKSLRLSTGTLFIYISITNFRLTFFITHAEGLSTAAGSDGIRIVDCELYGWLTFG
ncbi:hypothetical protein GCM10008933_30690 [Paenibacillus motobuensis]|uniref:Uncharacterized protein n=1 Tax=Paenibacillus motobuensis TaxID=295324 RepID=A0ABP3ICK5_9BACL